MGLTLGVDRQDNDIVKSKIILLLTIVRDLLSMIRRTLMPRLIRYAGGPHDMWTCNHCFKTTKRNKMKEIAIALSVALFSTASHAEIVRPIAHPAYVSSPTQARAAIQKRTFQAAPPTNIRDQWNLEVRHQGLAIDAANTSFNTTYHTGASVPSSYQWGPHGGSMDQSVFQLYNYNAGALMLSWDSPHPFDAPGCNEIVCNGYNKHTAYQYIFTNPPKVFDPALGFGDDVSLALQGNFRVAQFDIYDNPGPSNPSAKPIADLAWVIYLTEDNNSSPPIQLQVAMYSSHKSGAWYGVYGEDVGQGSTPYVATSMNGSPFVTIKADSAVQAVRTNTWGTQDFIRIHITPSNLRNIVEWYNYYGKPAQPYSYDVSKYRITSATVLQEMGYAKGDYAVFGASYYAPAVYQLKQ